MRVPISWLREYVDIDLSVDQLAERITNAGLEVGSIERIGVAGAPLEWDRDRVLLAHVLAVRPHPDADRLVIATVDHGAGQPKEVVTGAPNLFPHLERGDLSELDLWAALILEGATYLDPHKDLQPTKLKGRKLRGVYNDAMLCSPVELGLGEDHDGVLLVRGDELTPIAGGRSEIVAGRPLVDLLGDAVLEIDIIPNIARCASMVGVAREVAALTGKVLRTPSTQVVQEGPSIEGKLVIETREPELNPRFVAFLIEGVEQRPAPFWMQHRLRLAGQRPLHVVVDVSNYVMLEIGQPNHTFDWGFLQRRAESDPGYDPGGPVRLITRLAEPGEQLTTLDGTRHELLPTNILVTDPAGALSIGGVMGGEESEIQDHTTDVLLEAAAWKFTNIRQTQRQLGLHSEAGFRFSRGVHPELALLGARRAAELLRTLAGGTVAAGCIDHVAQAWAPVEIELDPAYVNERSGLDLSPEQIAAHLERLEFSVEPSTSGRSTLRVVAPPHRIDVEGPHDLLEEVCRMVGYENLPSTVLASHLPPQRGNPALEAEEAARDCLVRSGLHEVITYRLTTAESEARLRDEEVSVGPYVELSNPSTLERSALRRSLLASVLDVASNNARFTDRLALFEIGAVFLPRPDSPLPEEVARLAVLLRGPRQGAHWQDGTDPGAAAGELDYFDLKGVIEILLRDLHLDGAEFSATEHPTYRPGRAAELSISGRTVGRLGELHPVVARDWGFDERPCLVAELDLGPLLGSASRAPVVTPIPVYPAVREDLAFLVDESLPAAALVEALRSAGGVLLESIELFDLYQGDKIAPGKKSLAYRVAYRSPSKTLSDRDATRLRGRLVEAAAGIGATLRE